MSQFQAARAGAAPRKLHAWAPIIDTHVHCYTKGLPVIPHALIGADHDYTPEDFAAVLDGDGVAFGVLTAPSFLGTYNDYAFRVLEGRPRLKATAILEPGTDPGAMRAMDERGFVGVRYSLRKYPKVPDFSLPEFRPFLRRIIDLDWYVHLLAEPERMATMVPILARSGVKLVIDHFGVPDPASGENDAGLRAILAALEGGNTWIKLSGPYRMDGMDAKSLARRYLEIGGPERLVWGSDWPWTSHEGRFTYRDTIRWFEDWIPDTAIRDEIGRTGLRLNKFI